MLQSHYIRVSYARSFLAIGLALVALVACSSDTSDGGVSSSSGGVNPLSSSGISSSDGSVNPLSSSGTSSSDGSGNPGSSSENSSSSVSNPGGGSSSSGGTVSSEWPFDASGESLTASPGLEGLGLENVIKIEYKSGSAPVITNDFGSEVSITPTGENVVVRINTSETQYNFVLSGVATNGSLKFYGDVRKGLYLNGVNITNSTGPAINIQGGKRVLVHLINGTRNFLADGPTYNIPDGEQAKGTFFSEGKLEFEGSGSLEVKARSNHAIVADNDFEIKNGKITVSKSANDGIHANNKIEIKGGVLDISSKGDAIQSEKEKADGGTVIITGGKIKAQTTGIKSHGIASEGPVSIRSNAIIQISVWGNGSKGIRSRDYVEFKGGKTSIKTSGGKHTDPADPEDESNASGIKLTADLFIEGGDLTIKSLGGGAKGINTDGTATPANTYGNATITAGNVNIEADDDGIKVKRALKIQGGTVNITSKNKKAVNAASCTKEGGTINFQCGGF